MKDTLKVIQHARSGGKTSEMTQKLFTSLNEINRELKELREYKTRVQAAWVKTPLAMSITDIYALRDVIMGSDT